MEWKSDLGAAGALKEIQGLISFRFNLHLRKDFAAEPFSTAPGFRSLSSMHVFYN